MLPKLLKRFRLLFASRRPKPLNEWFLVTFDAETVRVRAEPPGREAWSEEFTWHSITRVCFKAEGYLLSDGIYIFTTQRAESYVVPTEANGGDELWLEIMRRGLFDAELALEAVRSNAGLYCWPPEGPDRD